MSLNSADLARNSSHSTILQFSQEDENRLKPLQPDGVAGTRVSICERSLVNFPIPRNLRAKDLALQFNLLSARQQDRSNQHERRSTAGFAQTQIFQRVQTWSNNVDLSSQREYGHVSTMSRIATTPSVYSLSAEWAEFKSPAPLPDRRVIQLANYFYFSGRSTSRACVAPRELGGGLYLERDFFKQHWLNNLAQQAVESFSRVTFSDNVSKQRRSSAKQQPLHYTIIQPRRRKPAETAVTGRRRRHTRLYL
ncbi:Hypothetical_protein [Hexamita inflata]|uniref:Hypothetical_protein n=1 Tax=Hexamita inflata TaxID=28002 RepID=A0ABP1HJ27_9EUKA